VGHLSKCVKTAQLVATPEHNHYKWLPDSWTDRVPWFDRRCEGHDDSRSCNAYGNIFIASTQGMWIAKKWWRYYMEAAAKELENRPSGCVVN
jgi:hypothetical protein